MLAEQGGASQQGRWLSRSEVGTWSLLGVWAEVALGHGCYAGNQVDVGHVTFLCTAGYRVKSTLNFGKKTEWLSYQ